MRPSNALSTRYSQLSDDELLKLAGEAETLTVEASGLLKEELQRRDLKSEDVLAYAGSNVTQPTGIANRPSVRFLRETAFFAGHLAISTLGVGMTVGMFFFSIRPVLPASLWAHGYVLSLPFFPIQVTVAIAAGYVLARKKGLFWTDSNARLVWIVPTIWMLFMFFSYRPYSALNESRWQHFFWTDNPRSRGMQLGVTMLFLTSIAYALGNMLGRASRPRDGSA